MPAGPHYQTKAYKEALRTVRDNVLPCVYCGKRATTVDHSIPVALGGGDNDLVPSCRPCNTKRGAKLGNQIMRAKKAARDSLIVGSRFLGSQTQYPPASQQMPLERAAIGGTCAPSRIW